jgi:hypothetical protein
MEEKGYVEMEGKSDPFLRKVDDLFDEVMRILREEISEIESLEDGRSVNLAVQEAMVGDISVVEECVPEPANPVVVEGCRVLSNTAEYVVNVKPVHAEPTIEFDHSHNSCSVSTIVAAECCVSVTPSDDQAEVMHQCAPLQPLLEISVAEVEMLCPCSSLTPEVKVDVESRMVTEKGVEPAVIVAEVLGEEKCVADCDVGVKLSEEAEFVEGRGRSCLGEIWSGKETENLQQMKPLRTMRGKWWQGL